LTVGHTGSGKLPYNTIKHYYILMAGLLTFGNVLLERGELVEVRGEETEATDLVDDVPGGRKRIRAMTERERQMVEVYSEMAQARPKPS